VDEEKGTGAGGVEHWCTALPRYLQE